MIEILPCPFCGSKRIGVFEDEASNSFGKCLICYCLCFTCHTRGPYHFKSVQDDEINFGYALENWNKRYDN